MTDTSRAPGRTQHERRAASNRELLEAAVRMIAQRGSTISLGDVGRAAGFSHALAGARYGSKSEFLRKVREYIMLRSARAWQDGAEGESAIDAVDQYLAWISEAGDEGRALYVLLTEALMLEADSRDAIATQNRALRTAVGRRIPTTALPANAPAQVTPETLSIVLTGLMRGITIQWMLEGSAIEMDSVRATARWLLERALDPREGQDR